MYPNPKRAKKLYSEIVPKTVDEYLSFIEKYPTQEKKDQIKNDSLYRECEVNYDDYFNDLKEKTEEINFSDLKLIFQNFKGLFKKQGYDINWKEIEKQSLDQTINTLSMASPFSLEEKQILLESKNLSLRKEKLEEILKTYILDNFNNKTIQ